MVIKLDGLVLFNKETGRDVLKGDIVKDNKGNEFIIENMARGRMMPKIVARPNRPDSMTMEFYPTVFPDLDFIEEVFQEKEK